MVGATLGYAAGIGGLGGFFLATAPDSKVSEDALASTAKAGGVVALGGGLAGTAALVANVAVGERNAPIYDELDEARAWRQASRDQIYSPGGVSGPELRRTQDATWRRVEERASEVFKQTGSQADAGAMRARLAPEARRTNRAHFESAVLAAHGPERGAELLELNDRAAHRLTAAEAAVRQLETGTLRRITVAGTAAGAVGLLAAGVALGAAAKLDS